MTIVKTHRIALLIIIMLLCGCMPMKKEPIFEVYGDQELLDQMIINIEASSNAHQPYKVNTLQTLLYNGKIYTVRNLHGVVTYTFYISFDDNFISIVTVDNVMVHRQDQINRLNITRVGQEEIVIDYISAKYELKRQVEPRKFVINMGKDLYFERYEYSEKEQKIAEVKLFGFYDPEESKETLEALEIDFIQYYESLSLEGKKHYYIEPEDLERMSIDLDEKRELIQHYHHNFKNDS